MPEFSIGIRAVETGDRIDDIPGIEALCPLICAIAGDTARMHNTAQLRKMNFFEFITVGF